MDLSLEEDANPYEQVKKLKFLVKQLELQNKQLLLNKQSASSNKVTRSVSLNEPNKFRRHAQEELSNGVSKDKHISETISSFIKEESINNESKEDISSDDILDIDKFELSDEDSWLYKSPKKLPPAESQINLVEWLNQDIEDLDNKQLQLAKSALVCKLEELAILSPSPKKTKKVSSSSSDESDPNNKSNSRKLDTRTFTRIKKRRELPPPVISRPDLDEVLNIHELARQQEETLRTSQLSPRRILVPKRPNNLSYWSSNSDIEGTGPELYNTTPTTAENSRESNKRFGACVMQLSSTHSSPVQPPLGGSSLYLRPRQEDVHRSMPNLNHKKLSSKTFKVSNRSSSNRLIPPPIASGRRLSTPRRESMPNGMSNSTYGGLSNSHASGLPRPSKPSPHHSRRSGIPGPNFRHNHTESELWSDGCF